MRILYLLNNWQESIIDTDYPEINLPWVDALLDKLVSKKNITIALAVPVDSSTIQKSEKENITVYGIPDPEERNKIIKAYKRFTRSERNCNINSTLPQIIKDYNPDLIQIFGSENCFGLIIKEIDVPVVIHIQGFLFALQRKWFSGISKWEQLRYASLKDLLYMRGVYHDSITFGIKAGISSTIIHDCKYFMGRTGFDKGIVSLISPDSTYFHCEEFIREDFFQNQWNMPSGDEIVCASILKGASYKGIDLLVETAIVLNKYSDKSFKFKICGVSEHEEIVRIIKKKYKKDFKKLGLEFLGKLPASEIVKHLCESNLYVHPSYMENSPNSVCEAMSLGMPIVATNVGGVSSILDDYVEGILVQEGEPYSMASAIVHLISNKDKAIEMGLKAKKKAVIRHQSDVIVENLLKIYSEIVDGSRK